MAIIDQLQALPQQWKAMLEDRFQPLIEQVRLIATRAKNPLESSYQHGCELLNSGQFKEAKMRFKFVLWRKPSHAKSWYQLALAHFSLQEKYEGIKALNKSLAFNTNDEEALYLKATIEGGKYADQYSPHTTPIRMVKAEFAERADGYNHHEFERNYIGHLLISRAMMNIPYMERIILDAGCGAGMGAPTLRPFAKKLIGVDISPHMIAEARAFPMQFYDEFIEVDIRDHLLRTKPNQYDAITSSNVIPIIGGLAPVMDGVANALTHEGYFIFNCYALQAMEGYQFINEMGRFSHSKNYIKQQAGRANLEVISITEEKLYEDDTRTAYVVTLKK